MPAPVQNGSRSAWNWLLIAIGIIAVLMGFTRVRRHTGENTPPADTNSELATATSGAVTETQAEPAGRARTRPTPAPTAEQVVRTKLSQFGRSRRELAYALAKKNNVQVPAEVERFFDAVESGNWDAIEAAFKVINGGDSSAGWTHTRTPEVQKLWAAIIDAYGAAEQVHLWPPQKLLDYGNAILGSLRPGTVYVGGTDNGRWIPELLNDTSEGERHAVLTQNALADGTYLDYLNQLYGDKLATLTSTDSQQAFQEYLADAQKRFQHDQQFPDEPKQVLPGEDIKVTNGKVEVGGRVAVMSINERLLQMLMQKNPDTSFALQESFPLRGTYADALPLGPLMELRAGSDQNPFTADRAAQSVDYWRATTQQVLADAEAAGSESALKSYSHDAVAAANLLASHGFSSQAQEAYGLAAQLFPGNPEAVAGLAASLAGTGHPDEAKQLLDEFARKYPDQQKALNDTGPAARIIWSMGAGK